MGVLLEEKEKMIKFRENKVILLGDTHHYQGTLNRLKQLPSDYDIILMGDGGEGFGTAHADACQLETINLACKMRKQNLYVIRGNHSNPDVWKRGYSFSNVELVQDYTPCEFPNGKTALIVGEGISVDRIWRKAGKDYWPDEVTVYQKQDKHYDILFAHDAPNYFNHTTESLVTSPWASVLITDKKLYSDAMAQRTVMNCIVADITPEWVYSGHFHNSISDEKDGIKYRCLNIDEVLTVTVYPKLDLI